MSDEREYCTLCWAALPPHAPAWLTLDGKPVCLECSRGIPVDLDPSKREYQHGR
jgi:hypothetical protein